jgi:hypothetical protein
MPQFRVDKELIQNISPTKIAIYLEYKGWKKEKEVEGVASLWSYRDQSNKKITLLLPLDKDFADFEIKIEELLSVVAKFENRAEAEVLKALANVSILAQRGYREIIDIKMESRADEQNDKYEASAKATGSVLKSLGNLFESLGDVIKKRTRKRASKTDIASELNLSLLDAFHGSFGIRTGLGVYKKIRQTSLLENPAAQEATEDFMNLITASSSSNPELLRRELEKLEGDALLRFKLFIKSLTTLDSDLVLEWGSVDPNKSRVVRFSYDKIVQALDIITKTELENPYQYEVIGKLILAGIGQGKEKRRFILIDETNDKEYKGFISLGLINNLNAYIELDKLYVTTIEETLGVNEITGEEVRFYTLVQLQELASQS